MPAYAQPQHLGPPPQYYVAPTRANLVSSQAAYPFVPSSARVSSPSSWSVEVMTGSPSMGYGVNRGASHRVSYVASPAAPSRLGANSPSAWSVQPMLSPSMMHETSILQYGTRYAPMQDTAATVELQTPQLPRQPQLSRATAQSLPQGEGSLIEPAAQSTHCDIAIVSIPAPERSLQSELQSGSPVILHVYEIGGGAFHAAVEVHGQEWQYGQDGITYIEPGSAGNYKRHLEPIALGSTLLNALQVRNVLRKMKRKWKGDDYNLLHKNCCHFSRRFLQELGAKGMPEWVDGWTNKVTPTIEAGFGAMASRGVVFGAEMLVTRTATASAGPAAWAAAAGDLVGAGIGARVGGVVGGAKGADVGKEVGGLSGSIGAGAGIGGVCGGPVGAGIGAGVGVVSWGIGKIVRAAIGEVPAAAQSVSHSSSKGTMEDD